MRFRKNPDLWIIGVLAVIGVFIGIFAPPSGIFSIFGILLVLVLPGTVYSLVILPELSFKERLLASAGMSIVIDGLSGLILDLTPWGLRASTWGIWLGAIVLVGIGILWRRRRKPMEIMAITQPVVKWNQVLLYGIAVVFILAAFSITRYSNTWLVQSITTLWATNDPANARDVQIGIQNQEGKAETYDLVAEVNGVKVREWSGIQVENAKTFTVQMSLDKPFEQPLRVLLYRSDLGNRAYREVQVSQPAPGAPALSGK